MLAPRGYHPKPQDRERYSKQQTCLCFRPGLDILGLRSLDPWWNFPNSARLSPAKFGDTRPAMFPPKWYPYSGFSGSRAARHAFQATDRRPELRSEMVWRDGGASRVPILPFSSFLGSSRPNPSSWLMLELASNYEKNLWPFSGSIWEGLPSAQEGANEPIPQNGCSTLSLPVSL